MKFSTDSWHYELVNFYLKESYPSDSLCIYFWQVFGFCIVSVAGVLLIGWVFFLFTALWVIIPLEVALEGNALAYAYFLGVLFFLQKLLKNLPDDNVVGKVFRYSPWGNKNVDKEPNLLVQYLKSKKEKICPQIEFY